MGSSWSGRRTSTLLGGSLLLGCLICWLLVSPGAQARAETAAPSETARAMRALPDPALLQKLQSSLEAAKAQKEVAAKFTIIQALGAKSDWIKALYEGTDQSLLGCTDIDASEVFRRLESIDLLLEATPDERNPREENLRNARLLSSRVAEILERCSTDKDAIKTAAAIAKTIRKLHEKADERGTKKLTDSELNTAVDRIGERKIKMLRGERVYGCDVVRIYLLVEKIDLLGDEAIAKSGKVSRRNKLLDEALEEVATLREIERQMPCGGTTTPPADPGCSGSATVFAGNERQFSIVCPAAGNVTNLVLTVPSNAIVNHLPPAGANCSIDNSGGNATYGCAGSMGDSPSFRLDFANNPSGQTAQFAVNNDASGGQIPIP